MSRTSSVLRVICLIAVGSGAGVAIAAPIAPAPPSVPLEKGTVLSSTARAPTALIDLGTVPRFVGGFSDGVAGRVEVVGEGLNVTNVLTMTRGATAPGSKLSAFVTNNPAGSYRTRFTFTNVRGAAAMVIMGGPMNVQCNLVKSAGEQSCDVVTNVSGAFAVTIGFSRQQLSATSMTIKSVQVVKEPSSAPPPPPPAATPPPAGAPAHAACTYVTDCPPGHDIPTSDCTLVGCNVGKCCYGCGQVGGAGAMVCY